MVPLAAAGWVYIDESSFLIVSKVQVGILSLQVGSSHLFGPDLEGTTIKSLPKTGRCSASPVCCVDGGAHVETNIQHARFNVGNAGTRAAWNGMECHDEHERTCNREDNDNSTRPGNPCTAFSEMHHSSCMLCRMHKLKVEWWDFT
jgi:hypothetical protein